MTAKSMGTKITGLGRLNHRGSTARIYSSSNPPTAKPDQTMVPLMRQSHSRHKSAGSSAATVSTNRMPERLTSSGRMRRSGGNGGSDRLRGISGWNTGVPQSGHFFSLSASSTPHLTQYIDRRTS